MFALITDVARKARLDPNASALAVGQETEGPVDVGTVFPVVPISSSNLG